ncbi:hypothetical protein ES703_119660 [subsurface metagenome]
MVRHLAFLALHKDRLLTVYREGRFACSMSEAIRAGRPGWRVLGYAVTASERLVNWYCHESEPVIKIRKMLLEMMWARAPRVQAIRDYGIKCSISRTKFEVAPTFCNLCGLCMRYCAEVKKKNAIGFIGRGTEQEVMFFPEITSEEHPKCGECYSICPPGVLPSNYSLAQVPHFVSSSSIYSWL